MAVPLINPYGRAMFAISVTGPRARLSDARIPRIGERLQDIAREIISHVTLQTGQN